MAQIQLAEAIRLGLVPDETIRRLEEQGLLTSPFIGARAPSAPFWRVPPVLRSQRGGLFQPRFGLGPLAQGLALSPPAPAISGGGVPVGRRMSRGNQPAPPLQTLIGRGDTGQLARMVANGTLDPNALPPELRRAVMSLLQQPVGVRQPVTQPQAQGPSDLQKGTAALKQVLSLARQIVKPGEPGSRTLDQALAGTQPEPMPFEMTQEARQAFEAQRAGERGQVSTDRELDIGSLVEPEAFDAAEGGVLPRLGAGAFDAAEGGVRPAPSQPRPLGLGSIGGGTPESLRMVGGEPAPELVYDPATGIWSPIDVGLPPEAFDAAEGGALPTLGPGAFDVAEGGSPTFDATPIDEFGAGVEPGGGVQSGGPSASAIIGGVGGALSIAQAIQDENASDEQKALRATQGAIQTANAASQALGYGAIPYAGEAAAGLNIALTATGEGSDEYKAAAAAVDVAAYALSGFTFGISTMVAPSAKAALYKAFYDVPHEVRESQELARTAQTTQQFTSEIQAAKSLPELYQTLRNWQTGYVGGITGKDTQHGLDPIAFNVYAAPNQGRSEWNYLGLYKDGGIDPMAPSMNEFFQRLLEHPEDFSVVAQAGIGPEDQGVKEGAQTRLDPLNRSVMANIREQVGEIRAREQIRPIMPAFSRMAGVFVSEDDVIESLRQGGRTGVQIGTPEFADILRQSERGRVAKAATEEAMVAWPGMTGTRMAVDPAALAQYAPHEQDYARGILPKVSQSYRPGINEEAFSRTTPEEQQWWATMQSGSPPWSVSPQQAGFTFKPGEGFYNSQGVLEFPTAALTPPVPWVEPATAPIAAAPGTPASTAELPPVAPSPTAATAPSPEEQPVPVEGIMRFGGLAPRTGLYHLEAGERVLPNLPTRQISQAGNPAIDEMLRRAEQGQRVGPAGRYFRPGVQPQVPVQAPPAEPVNPLAPIRPGETEQEIIDRIMKRKSELPEGRYYLDPKKGVPFSESSNPEPSRAWRLVFDPEELHRAWKNRAKDGAPLLVPPSVLERPDWPTVVERARQSQYQTVHPAVLLAREMPPRVLGGSHEIDPTVDDEIRFEFGQPQPRLPQSEPSGPMRKNPPHRPMTPDELDEIDRPPQARA